ncbi:hypothetical protein CE154_012995 [Alicycliphilus denitrificans]|uniref:Integrase catalytic domain-containing protein n=2 Tax=Alicycliphilus denitrificans TaxID=179636 RepID=A0A3R7HPA2_9BURK|nr:hypothetical protein CE154_012995 [Alicycliphilus denitrificans]
MKYRPNFPARFGSLADACAHCQTFFAWYNTEHQHPGIGYMTPSSVHYGEAHAARALRQDALDAAFEANPKRFKGRRPAPPASPTRSLDQPTRNGENQRLEHPGFNSKFLKHGDAKSLICSAPF